MGDKILNVIFPEHRKGLINMTVLLPLCLQKGWREKCAGVSVWKNTPKGGFTAPLQLRRDFTVGIRPCSVLRRDLEAWGVWGWPCLGSYYWCILVSLVNLTHLGRETISWRIVSKEWSVGISMTAFSWLIIDIGRSSPLWAVPSPDRWHWTVKKQKR